ncbi:solute carrier family 35 member G1-like [Brevipalpus obovatus]|uniref:solute carrier family 35 member G1-like n=1 Tax=Brevipalpus obovatus TaxID=246614 RepID=UPI003D9F03D7
MVQDKRLDISPIKDNCLVDASQLILTNVNHISRNSLDSKCTENSKSSSIVKMSSEARKPSQVSGSSSSFSRRASETFSNLRRHSVQLTISAWQSLRGIIFAIIASTLFSMSGMMVKFATDVDPALMCLLRFFEMGIFGAASLVSVPNVPILGPRDARIWIFLRGITGATGMYLRYVTIHLLPLANAMVLILTVPVFTSIFARIFFKEPCGLFHVVALTIALIGISLTAKIDAFIGLHSDGHDSPHNSSTLLGLFTGLGAALSQTATALIVRHLKNVHFAVIVFNCSWVACIELVLISYFLGVLHLPNCGYSGWLVMLVGVGGYFGQVFYTRAMKYEEAGIVTMTQCSSDLFIAFVVQICVFRIIPDSCTIIGSAMVFSAVLFTSMRKYLVTLSKDHYLRRYFGFILK